MDDHPHVPTDELRALAASYRVPEVDAEMVRPTDRSAVPQYLRDVAVVRTA